MVVIVVVNMEMSSVNQTFRNHCCGAVSRCTHSAAASGGSKNQGAEKIWQKKIKMANV